MKDALIQKVDRSAPVKGKAAKKDKDTDPTAGWVLNKCKILVPYILEPVAMDCEMVLAGSAQRSSSVLARVSIVAQNGHVIYDKMVKPMAKIVDYLTPITGFTKNSFTNAIDHRVCAREVDSILRDRIVVGHGLINDFKVLMFSHPAMLTRDLATYSKFQRAGKAAKLRELAQEQLGKTIQESTHDSVEDARVAMEIYAQHKVEWEKSLSTQFGYKLAQHRRVVVKRAAQEEKHRELQALLAAKRLEKADRKRKREESRKESDDDDDDDDDDDESSSSEAEAKEGSGDDSGSESESSDSDSD